MRSDTNNIASMSMMSVIAVIRARGPVGGAQISLLTGLDMSCVKKIIAALKESGLVLNAVKSHGDDQPELLVFDETVYYLISAEAGRERLRVAVTDLDGTVICKMEEETGGDAAPRAAAEALTALTDKVIIMSGIPPLRFLGMGICVNGLGDKLDVADFLTGIQKRSKMFCSVIDGEDAADAALVLFEDHFKAGGSYMLY
jgi:hypothetical protein